MYISKPDNGFSIPVIYVKNEQLYINKSEDISSEVEEKKFKLFNFDGMTRDRLFTEEDEIDFILDDREAENKENYKKQEDTSNYGKLEFDVTESIEKDYPELKKEENVRTTMEVQYEDVGKLVVDKEEVDTKKEDIETKKEKAANIQEKPVEHQEKAVESQEKVVTSKEKS